MTMIPNGVDLPRFRTVGAASAAAGRGQSRQIVQLGRYVVDKEQLETIHAFEVVLQESPTRASRCTASSKIARITIRPSISYTV